MGEDKKFKLMKNGYDRFQVDDYVKQTQEELQQLKEGWDYKTKELARLEQRLNQLQLAYDKLQGEYQIKDQLSDEISRIALSEANTIIQGASNNADTIIKEALTSAKVILTELAYTVKMTKDARNQMKDKINDILQKIDDFETIQLPNLEWLENMTSNDQDD
ncbi:MAG: DivIVA domain-containing protein [Erysipelotrichaceae bacterium]